MPSQFKKWFWDVFGHPLNPTELLRKNQRALNKAIREFDKERAKMEAQEKKIIFDLKKMAKAGQMDSVRILAKDLVRTREYIKKFMLMKANLQAVSMKILTLRSQHAVGEAMKGVVVSLRTMNANMRIPQIQNILQQFEKQSDLMGMKEEMINDYMDDAMAADEKEEESDAIMTQIFDELGLELNTELTGLPEVKGKLKPQNNNGAIAVSLGTSSPTLTQQKSMPNEIDDELQARLDNLRRDDLSNEIPPGKKT